MSTSQSFGSLKDELEHYKAQYEHLESELQEFQQSSKELEAELEKDVEASEKRERALRDQVDALGFQVNEWKNKYNQSRTESNAAQNKLQKEITTLRDANRTLQMKVRDMEVANDEYEVMARNTTTSLDDLESKYNQAVERNVLLEDEMKQGEQERETLRIESQRLKDELSDLRVENDIVTGKLRAAEIMTDRRPRRTLQEEDDKLKRPSSTYTDKSATTVSTATTRSHHISRSEVSISEPQTPPSPQYSDGTARSRIKQPQLTPSRSDMAHDDTPRPEHMMQKKLRARPSYGTRRTRPSILPADALVKLDTSHNPGLPQSSNSLYQIRGLRDKMQKLEERLHTVKSRLPNPSRSPAPAEEESVVPATITMRSPTKRRSHSVMAPPPLPQASEIITSTRSPRPPVPPKDEQYRSSTSHSYRTHDGQHRSLTSHSHKSSQEQIAASAEARLPPRSSSRMSASISRPPSSFSAVRQEEPEPGTNSGRSILLETGSLRRPRASEAHSPVRQSISGGASTSPNKSRPSIGSSLPSREQPEPMMHSGWSSHPETNSLRRPPSSEAHSPVRQNISGGTLGRSSSPSKSRPSIGSSLPSSTAGTGTSRRKSNIARPGLGAMLPPERRV